jgi:hypothetical protein
MPFNVEGGFNQEGGDIPLPPQGATVITDVSTQATSALVSFDYSAADFTGFDYRIDGGMPVDIATINPFTVLSLTPNTMYDVEVRAYNNDGDGVWSDAFGFQTDSASVIQSTVCFNGELNNLEFSGEFSSLEFNGKIKTRC